MTEAQIEEMILQYLAAAGFFCWKNPTAGYFDGKTWRKQASKWAVNGVSDIIAIKDSHILFLEVKTPIGKQSDHQKSFEKRIVEAGGAYHLVRSVDDIKAVLAAIKTKPISCYG